MRCPIGARSPDSTGSMAGGPVGSSSASLLTKHLADRVHDRVELGGLLRAGGPGRRLLLHVFPNAFVLLPPLQGDVEVDRLPLRVAVLREPVEVARDELGEPPHGLAIVSPEVE